MEKFEYNRSLLGKTARKPFQELVLRSSVKAKKEFEDPALSERDRIMILSGVYQENLKERRRQIYVLVASIFLTMGLVISFLTWWDKLF